MPELEIQMAEVKRDVSYLKETVGKIDKRTEQFHDKMDKFIQSADERYASNKDYLFWRNNFIIGIISMLVAGIIALIEVFKK